MHKAAESSLLGGRRRGQAWLSVSHGQQRNCTQGSPHPFLWLCGETLKNIEHCKIFEHLWNKSQTLTIRNVLIMQTFVFLRCYLDFFMSLVSEPPRLRASDLADCQPRSWPHQPFPWASSARFHQCSAPKLSCQWPLYPGHPVPLWQPHYCETTFLSLHRP